MTSNNLKNASDGELIKHYVQHRGKSDVAMRELVGRHHEQMYARFLSKVKNESDAHDLQQELWSRVAQNLHRYNDEGKFAHYLSKLASNIVIDFYRKAGRDKENLVDTASATANDDDHDDWQFNQLETPAQNAEEQVSDNELVHHLTTVLIPQLPVEQRTAWLLRHESEYWEPSSRFEWRHLAQLNGLSAEEVATIFDSARYKLMTSTSKGRDLEEIELLVFMVWTQAQRLDKSANFTWDYFADLLGQPVNTMKTRYRTAQKSLNKSLTEYMQS